jgi:prophage antirepressor-like protein
MSKLEFSDYTQTFNFQGIKILASVTVTGDLWFRATEVCSYLNIVNPSVVVKREAPNCWIQRQVGYGRPAIYISEAGLYALIFSSKNAEAQKMREWVYETVLPSIRRNNSYTITKCKQSIPICILETVKNLGICTIKQCIDHSPYLLMNTTWQDVYEISNLIPEINIKKVMRSQKCIDYHNCILSYKETNDHDFGDMFEEIK